MKKPNRNRIYDFIRTKSSVCRQDIVMELKLSLPTVVQNILELQQEGLIFESGSLGNTGGRRAKIYSVTSKFRVAIGMDITRNHISLVVVNLLGDIILHKRMRHAFSVTEEYFRKLGQVVTEAVAELMLLKEQIMGVGIGVPGLITGDCQMVYYGKILNFTGTTSAMFGKFIPFPCKLYNDADAAGFAESRVNKELADAFYISLGNNVGGSVLINNQVFKGDCARSGEVGHMVLVPGGRSCYCGQRGCLEMYCAATILSDYTGGNLAEFFRRLKQGDEECAEVWSEYLKYLVIGVNNVRMLFGCKVILGGYVGAYMENYIEELRRMACQINTFEDDADYLVVCNYKTEAIAAGAALPFVEAYVNNI